MRIDESKNAILNSLTDLNGSQTKQVLYYIRTLITKDKSVNNYSLFKKNALEQINKALQEA